MIAFAVYLTPSDVSQKSIKYCITELKTPQPILPYLSSNVEFAAELDELHELSCWCWGLWCPKTFKKFSLKEWARDASRPLIISWLWLFGISCNNLNPFLFSYKFSEFVPREYTCPFLFAILNSHKNLDSKIWVSLLQYFLIVLELNILTT